MKRTIAVFMLVCFCLSGCAFWEERLQEPATFYYLQKEYVYGDTDGVLAPESKETSGHRRDLSYLMALYLMGPTVEEHTMPLPAGTRIYATVQENGDIVLVLSEAALVLSDSELTLAGACLSMTCFDFTNAEKVTVQNGERSISMNRSSLLLKDDNSETLIVEETK